MKILRFIRLAALVSIVLLNGCTKQNTTQTEILFWAMGSEGEYVGQLLPRFHAENPDIRVKVQTIPWGAAHEKLLTAFAGNSLPDVCQLGNTWIPEFHSIDALVNLDSLVVGSNSIRPQDYFSGIWQTNLINKKIFGIPWYVDTRLLFYRTDLLAAAGFQRPPANWDEWLKACSALSRKLTDGRRQYGVFLPTTPNDWQIPVFLIRQNGGRLLRENDSYGNFSHPLTLEALRYYLRFFDEGLAPRKMTEVANIYDAFADGFFAMMITGPWNVNELQRRQPELAARWDTAPLPRHKNGVSLAGGSSLVIFNSCTNQNAAFRLLEYLSEVHTQMQFFELTRDLPAVKPAWQTQQLQNTPKVAAFYRQLEETAPMPAIAEWEQIAIKMQQYLEMVIYGRLDLDTAMHKLDGEVNHILEKRRWLLAHGLID